MTITVTKNATQVVANQTTVTVNVGTTGLQGPSIQMSAPDKLLGRVSAGAGNPEEIACTAAGRALLDDANAAAQLATLGAAAAVHSHALTAITDVTATATELNFCSGLTANIQTQLGDIAAALAAIVG